jgi:hypothetical protein
MTDTQVSEIGCGFTKLIRAIMYERSDLNRHACSVHRLRGEHTYLVPSCDVTASCHVAYPCPDYGGLE